MRRIAGAGLTLVCLASYLYFYQAGGWNQNTRFDLVRAIVERHTLSIDAYHQNTGDKALSGGHYYSDKAPGASFVAVPAVALARGWPIRRRARAPSAVAVMRLSYVATVAAASVPGAFTALCVWAMNRRLGSSDPGAAMAAIAFGLATPFWAYSTLLFGHALAACCVASASWCLDRLRDRPLDSRRDWRCALGGGLLAGWSVVTEFPGVLAALVLALAALVTVRDDGAVRLRRVIAGFALGGALALSVLLLYNEAAFGSPLHVGYASEENSALLRAGFFGITAPKPSVVIELLFGWYRGLLPVAPVFVLAPLGWWHLWWSRVARPTVAAAVAIPILFLLLNAGYEHWEGGWVYGPRHLTPSFPLLSAGLGLAWDRSSRVIRALFVAAVLAGGANSLAAVATTPQPPAPTYLRPLQQLIWPAFVEGRLSINTQSFLDYGPTAGLRPAGVSWNVGQQLGLDGLASLAPLFAMWLVGGGIIAWCVQRRRSTYPHFM